MIVSRPIESRRVRADFKKYKRETSFLEYSRFEIFGIFINLSSFLF